MLIEPEGEDVRVIDMYGERCTFTAWLRRLSQPPDGFADSPVARRHWQDGNPVEWAINEYVYSGVRE